MTRKIKVQTDNSSWKAPKKRKPRKPMSEQQRIAAAERLEKAREKKKEKNPSYGKGNIHKSLWNLPSDHQLHPDKIKVWIKTQADLARVERAQIKQNVKGAIAKLANHEGYIRHMKSYLRHGDWCDMFYGEYQEKKIRNRNVALGYYWYGPNIGKPKRDVGTFYPDLNVVWEMGMEE